MKMPLSCLLWLIALCANAIHGANIPAAEMSALKDLYDSTNGTNWRWDESTSTIGTITSTNGVPWVFTPTANPCTEQWQGLNCSFPAPFTYYHISKLVLVLHNLEGTLPATIGNLSRLHYLNLEDNHISGTLPQTLTKLSGLLVLNLAVNRFIGPVPHSIQDLSHLQQFILYSNKLSGQLPNIFVTLANLRTVSLNSNRLSGEIPSSIGSLPQLAFLYLESNHFTGSIPEALCQMTHMVDLKLQSNYLHGPVPPCLGSLPSLNLLELSNNGLTGTIPDTLGALSSLTVLYLQENQLTGSIPDTVSGLTNMLNFNVNRNRLTGTLPQGMASFTKMTNLYLHDNYLSGTLHAMVGWEEAIFLYMHDNLFSGTLPVLTNLTHMTTIFLKNNKLSGSLDDVFDPIQNALITTIQFSDNQFTGTLPESIFEIAQLSTFAAVSNCFTGSLPRSICSSTSLNTLVLDGLHSATSCRNNILPGVANRYILEAKIEGGIPACVFAVPNLQTLHLSGNGLTGTISTDLGISTDLRDLSVSHNALTGTIPESFQSKRWYNLDLSYNKFRGSLQKNYESSDNNNTVVFYNITLTKDNVALSLRNNRLSGNIPNQLKLLQNISILDGNLFGCSLDQSDLPSNDQGESTYQCGSNSFNVSYYIWLTTTGFVVVFVGLILYFRHSIGSYLRFDRIMHYYDKWMHHVEFVHERDSVLGKDITLKNFKYLMYVCEGVCKVSIYCTAYILVVLIPIYAISAEYYSTHNYTYAWSVSAAFLSGPVALALLMVAFVSLLFLAFVLFTTHIRLFLREQFEFFRYTEERIRRPTQVDGDRTSTAAPAAEKSKIPLLRKILVYVIFFIINFTVVLGVNVAYVYVRLYQPSSLFVIAQLLLSVFKVVWNSFCSVYIIRWVDDYLTESSSDDWKSTESGFFAIQLFVALFNYIAIPCLVVGVISPDCYNNVLINYAPVSSRFRFAECEVFNSVLGCTLFLPQIDETTYNPPFTYSYQCSSSIITFYAPSFVYLSFIMTFISPLLELVCEKWHSRRVRGTFMAGQLDYWVPLILQTLELRDEPTRAKYDIFNPYLDSNLLLVTIITHLGVLLTFGVVFPPLAVCMLISILAVTFNTKLTVGRFLTNAIDTGLTKYVNIIESECEGAGSIPKLRQCMRLLLMFCFCFYTPFLFDTLGDSVGLGGSYWVIFFLPLLAATGISIKYALKKTFPDVLRVPEDQRYSSYSSSRGSRYSNHNRMVEMSNSVSLTNPLHSGNSVSSGKSTTSVSPHGSPLHSVGALEVGEQLSAAPRPSYLATPTASPPITPVVSNKKSVIASITNRSSGSAMSAASPQVSQVAIADKANIIAIRGNGRDRNNGVGVDSGIDNALHSASGKV